MPFYRLKRKFDDGYQVHPHGAVIEFPATKTHPDGLAPSTAVRISDDEILAEKQAQSSLDEAATRVAKERMKAEILAELTQETNQRDAVEEVKAMTPPEDKPTPKQKAT